jgi:hypothetical protein
VLQGSRKMPPRRQCWLVLGVLVGVGHAQGMGRHRRLLNGDDAPPGYMHEDSVLDSVGSGISMHRPPLPPAMTGPFPPGSMDSLKGDGFHMLPPPVRALPSPRISKCLGCRGGNCQRSVWVVPL